MHGSFLVWALRDRLVDAALRVSRETLNGDAATPPAGAARDAGALAEELRGGALAFKAEALDAEGGRPDYRRVEESEGYRRLQTSAAGLRGLALQQLHGREERLAFWINVYNALLIQGAIAYGLRESVKEARGGRGGFFRRTAYEFGGRRYSLDDIEHGILRANRGHPWLPGPQFSGRDARRDHCLTSVDPRLHFALNCGAASCPPVRAYRADAIDQHLDLATRGFLNGAEGVCVQVAERRVELPKVFHWYRVDFGGRQGGRAAGRQGGVVFAARYLDEAGERALLLSGDLGVRYRPYDWTLG